MAPAIALGFLFFWAAGKLLRSYVFPAILGKAQWRKHSSEHQRTMVIYVLQAVVTTIALILQFSSVDFYSIHFTVSAAKRFFVAVNLVLILYIVELLYREQMRIQMNAHHLLTICVLVFACIMLYQTCVPATYLTLHPDLTHEPSLYQRGPFLRTHRPDLAVPSDNGAADLCRTPRLPPQMATIHRALLPHLFRHPVARLQARLPRRGHLHLAQVPAR